MITKSLSRNFIFALLLSFLFLLFVIKKESFETFQLLDFYSATLFLGQMIVIFFILYWPGRAIAEIILKKLTSDLKNAVSFGISIFILAILALIIIKFDQIKFIPHLLSVLVILSIFFLACKRMLFECFEDKALWKMFGLAVIFMIVYQLAVFSFHTNFLARIDYALPYGSARIFYMNYNPLSQQALDWLGGFYINDRTPLLAFVQLNFMKLFNSFNPLIYVKLALLSTLLFYFPLYVWLKPILAKNWIKILLIVILLNPYIICFNLESPTKFFGVYFILLFYLFLLKPPKEIKPWQSFILTGIFGGLAILTHLYTTAFLLAGFFYKVWQKPKALLYFNTAVSGFLTILPALIWFRWTKNFHPGGSNLFMPMVTNLHLQDFVKLEFWQEKWHILSAMFVYYDQGRYQWERFFTNFSVYRYSFFSITFSLFLFSLLAIIKLSLRYKKEFFFLFAMPILIFVFSVRRDNMIMPFYEGVMHIQPIIFYLVVAGVWFLSKIKSKIIQYLILGLFILEHFYAVWFLQWDIFIHSADKFYLQAYAQVENFWPFMPLIIAYAFLIIIFFNYLKDEKYS